MEGYIRTRLGLPIVLEQQGRYHHNSLVYQVSHRQLIFLIDKRYFVYLLVVVEGGMT